MSTIRKDDEYLRDHHFAKKTVANPCSEISSDYYELYKSPNEKTSPMTDERDIWAMHKSDAFWKSRERFTNPDREKNSTLEDTHEAQNSITPATYDGSGNGSITMRTLNLL